MPYISYHADRHETEDKDTVSFFVEALGRELAMKMCPDQLRAVEKVIHSQAFP